MRRNGRPPCRPGETHSTEFPTTLSAYDRTFNGKIDAWLSILDTTKTARAQMRYSTFLGGTREDMINGVFVDGSGLVKQRSSRGTPAPG